MHIHLITLMLFAAATGGRPPSTPPAVIWGAKLKETRNIFQVVKSKKLATRLRPLLQHHMLVVYFENQLTAKDLSCTNAQCFPFLRQTSPRTYYSKVRDLLLALEKLSIEQERPLILSERDDMLNLPCQPKQIHVFNFRDNQLAEHDRFMETVSFNLKNCPVVQVYTAQREQEEATQLRVRKESDRLGGGKNSETEVRSSPQLMSGRGKALARTKLRRPQPVVLRQPNIIIALARITFAEEIERKKSVVYNRKHIILEEQEPTLTLLLADGKHIRKGFRFVVSTNISDLTVKMTPVFGNWRLSSVHFLNITFKSRDLVFYGNKFSLCCKALTAYSKHGSRITLFSFNMDVILRGNVSAVDRDYKPKACWYCQQYGSPAIIQALFTVGILLFLLAAGLTAFFKMGTNARLATVNDPEPYVKVPSEH